MHLSLGRLHGLIKEIAGEICITYSKLTKLRPLYIQPAAQEQTLDMDSGPEHDTAFKLAKDALQFKQTLF